MQYNCYTVELAGCMLRRMTMMMPQQSFVSLRDGKCANEESSARSVGWLSRGSAVYHGTNPNAAHNKDIHIDRIIINWKYFSMNNELGIGAISPNRRCPQQPSHSISQTFPGRILNPLEAQRHISVHQHIVSYDHP